MTKKQKTRQAWSPETEAKYTRQRIERADDGNQTTLTEFAQWLADSRVYRRQFGSVASKV